MSRMISARPWPSDPRGFARGSILRLGAGLAITACVALYAFAPSGAFGAATISGTWDCCGAGGAAAQTFVITDHAGSLSGKATYPSGGVFAAITGTASGNSVRIVTTYTGGGYVATFLGTVSSGGTAMSGSWSSNVHQSGT